jgi:N-acetylglucosaminyldiphosphoundecaprenol N-acetyl-beta-D-mannosaminyltransferase
MKVNIANVLVDKITAAEAISKIDEFVASGKPHYIVTTYSEFVVFASKDPSYLEVLNKADLSLPDGSGILWAAKYLSLNGSYAYEPFTQLVASGASLIFKPDYVKDVIHEKVSGSKLIWDIAKLASDKNYSMALVGSVGDVAEKAAAVLKVKFPNLKINLAVSDVMFDASLVQRIASSNSDILCIAYSPPKQETWIAHNVSSLNVKVAIGLGGTLDYLAGRKSASPEWMTNLGLEWFWRLITQPYRYKRMWNAIPVFISVIYKFKVKQIHGQS